ncbi:MAG TPA: hypothetical protein VIS07_09790 [Candidatus Binatia bacterium]
MITSTLGRLVAPAAAVVCDSFVVSDLAAVAASDLAAVAAPGASAGRSGAASEAAREAPATKTASASGKRLGILIEDSRRVASMARAAIL